MFAIPAVLLSSDVGAGNSGATLGLAASILGPVLLDGQARTATLLRAAGVLGAGAWLIALLDAHGIGVVGGLAIGLVIVVLKQRTAKPATGRRAR